MDYAIYNPDITTTTVVNPYDDPSGLTYVSNSSLAYYGGKFWAVMDGTTEGTIEGSPGQQIYLTTSIDGVDWTPAVRPFGDSAYCENPITSPALQWQPNLVVVGDELWCTWTGEAGYVSKLASPLGSWTNYRFEFDGLQAIASSRVSGDPTPARSTRASYGGISDWLPFFSQNPTFLADGVLVCPLTIYSRTESNQTPAADGFLRSLKFNALMSTADGTIWSTSLIDTSAFGDFCAWEPFVVQSRAGHVSVFSRNLNTLAADPDFLLVAVSKDGGSTFSPSTSTKMLVPSSRGFARRISASRWVMVHADHPQRSDQTPNQRLSLTGRRNGALFVSRHGVDDFVPGVNFSGKDTSMNYPQFIVGPNDALYINYTSGAGVDIRRSLRVAKVSPMPRDDLAYIHPRSVNVYADRSPIRPTRRSDSAAIYYDFDGRSQVLSRISLTAPSGVTYAAWLKWNTGGDVIMDSRGAGASAFGQVLHLNGLAIRSLNFLHGFTLQPDTPTFVAAVIDNSTQTVQLCVGIGGDRLMSKTGHFRCVHFHEQPADGDVITVDDVTYTFRLSPATDNDVAIGSFVGGTITNLCSKLAANSIMCTAPGANRLIMARRDIADFSVICESSNISNESSIPLGGGHVGFGRPVGSSKLRSFAGQIYDARLYGSALSTANLSHIYNEWAPRFGLSTLFEQGVEPGVPVLHLNPAKPDPRMFAMPGGAGPARCEALGTNMLRIYGEGSAGVELPYESTRLNIRYKLSSVPAGTERYIIATFGCIDQPLRLYIDGIDPTKLYANGVLVASVAKPTSFNSLVVSISSTKVIVSNLDFGFSVRPRCYLGSAFPVHSLPASRNIDYDVSAMKATQLRFSAA